MQLDLFAEPTTARPTRLSATGVVERVARRLGYDWCGQCVHCGRFVTLAGAWRSSGWLHRDTGAEECRPQDVALREHYFPAGPPIP